MDELPKIVAPEPVIIPATKEAVFPDIHFINLNIELPLGGVWSAMARYVPYNYETKEADVRPESMKFLRIEDIGTIARERMVAGKPALAQAMGAIATALAELVSEQK